MTTVFGYITNNFITITGDGVIYSKSQGKIVEKNRIKVWNLPEPYSNFVISMAGNIDLASYGYNRFIKSIKKNTSLWQKIFRKPNNFNFVSEILVSEFEGTIQEGEEKYPPGTKMNIECLVGCFSKEEHILLKYEFNNEETKITPIKIDTPIYIGLIKKDTMNSLSKSDLSSPYLCEQEFTKQIKIISKSNPEYVGGTISSVTLPK